MKAARIRLDDRSLIVLSQNGALRMDTFSKSLLNGGLNCGCVSRHEW